MSAPLDVLVAERRRFRAFLVRRLGDPDEAEDVLQSALLRAVRRPPTADDPEAVTRWFYRVLRNALSDRARRRQAAERAAATLAAEPASTPADTELWNAVCGCVTALADTLHGPYSEILRSVDIEGRPVAEAASQLGLTPGNARVRLHRARAALREQVERFCRTCATHGCLDCTCRTAPGV
jgi:RNA polymerase sigma factor (sigma-70 family)